jgi:hypothetical protein
MSAYVAATDYELDCWRFCEHASDQIQNGAGKTTGIAGQGDMGDCLDRQIV